MKEIILDRKTIIVENKHTDTWIEIDQRTNEIIDVHRVHPYTQGNQTPDDILYLSKLEDVRSGFVVWDEPEEGYKYAFYQAHYYKANILGSVYWGKRYDSLTDLVTNLLRQNIRVFWVYSQDDLTTFLTKALNLRINY